MVGFVEAAGLVDSTAVASVATTAVGSEEGDSEVTAEADLVAMVIGVVVSVAGILIAAGSAEAATVAEKGTGGAVFAGTLVDSQVTPAGGAVRLIAVN